MMSLFSKFNNNNIIISAEEWVFPPANKVSHGNWFVRNPDQGAFQLVSAPPFLPECTISANLGLRFRGAARANFHTLSGLNTQKRFPSWLWRPPPGIQVSAEPVPSGGSEIGPARLRASSGAGRPWRPWACRLSSVASAPSARGRVPLRVSVCVTSSYGDTSPTGVKARPSPAGFQLR